jgi:hypothetical protein
MPPPPPPPMGGFKSGAPPPPPMGGLKSSSAPPAAGKLMLCRSGGVACGVRSCWCCGNVIVEPATTCTDTPLEAQLARGHSLRVDTNKPAPNHPRCCIGMRIAGRGALLQGITKGAKLKKTVTVDKSGGLPASAMLPASALSPASALMIYEHTSHRVHTTLACCGTPLRVNTLVPLRVTRARHVCPIRNRLDGAVRKGRGEWWQSNYPSAPAGALITPKSHVAPSL